MNKKWIFLVLFSIIFGATCENPKIGIDQLFPGAGFAKGWSWHAKPKHFSSNNLYEYINGEAELYLSYNFKELSTLTYFWGAPEDTFLTVDIYDMGTVLNAFGLYSSYRYPEYRFERIGAEAFVSDFGLKMFKGRFVAEIKSSDNSGRCQKAVLAIAEGIAGRITEPADFPKMIAILPEMNQIPHSLRYYSNEMLNQAFLPEGLMAKYRMDGEEVSAFVIIFGNDQKAEEGFQKLITFYRESGGQFLSSVLPQNGSFGVKTAYHGFTCHKIEGKVLYGMQDLRLPEKGSSLMLQMKRTISQYFNHQ